MGVVDKTGEKPVSSPDVESPTDTIVTSDSRNKGLKGTVGISGLRMRKDLNLLQVTNLDSQGPAMKSGMVQINDCLLRVAGSDIKGMEAQAVMPLLRGAVGSKVKIVIQRGPDEFVCTLIRAEPYSPTKKDKAMTRSESLKKDHRQGAHKATDREKAERLAGGGAQARINRHHHSSGLLIKATEEETKKVMGAAQKLKDDAQAVADKWYSEQVKKDEQENYKKIDEKFQKLDKVMEGYTDPIQGILNMWTTQPDADKSDKSQSLANKLQANVSTTVHGMRSQLKGHIREKKQKAKANLVTALLQYKLRTAGNEIGAFFEGKPAKKKGFFRGRQTAECCSFCSGPRRK